MCREATEVEAYLLNSKKLATWVSRNGDLSPLVSSCDLRTVRPGDPVIVVGSLVIEPTNPMIIKLTGVTPVIMPVKVVF